MSQGEAGASCPGTAWVGTACQGLAGWVCLGQEWQGRLGWASAGLGKLGAYAIAVACVLRFVREAHPEVFDAAQWPALARHAEACEALPVFASVVQPFTVTLPSA